MKSICCLIKYMYCIAGRALVPDGTRWEPIRDTQSAFTAIII